MPCYHTIEQGKKKRSNKMAGLNDPNLAEKMVE